MYVVWYTPTVQSTTLSDRGRKRQKRPHKYLHRSDMFSLRLKEFSFPVQWVPDSEAKRCMSCNHPFSVTTRRHHWCVSAFARGVVCCRCCVRCAVWVQRVCHVLPRGGVVSGGELLPPTLFGHLKWSWN